MSLAVMRIVDLRASRVKGSLVTKRAVSHARMLQVSVVPAREVPGAGGAARADSPPPPPPQGGAWAARLPPRSPAPTRRRLADPFAPSEETKYTFVSDRRTVAGRRVRGPRARLWAAAPSGPKEVGCGSRPGRADLPPTPTRPEGQPRPAPVPAAALRLSAQPWPVDFTFRALGKVESGRARAGESGPRNCGLASAGLPLNLLPLLASSRPSVAPAALAPAILGQISRSRSRAPARPQRGEP